MLLLNGFVTVQASRNNSEMLVLFWGEENKSVSLTTWSALPYIHPHLQQWLATLDTLHSQEGQCGREEKKSTGETRLDKIITGMQLIFCFRPINFSTLPLILQIWLFNQLERNSTAGYALPHLLCFCLNPSSSFAAQSSEGRGRRKEQREKRDSPDSTCGGLTLAMITVWLFWSSFLPVLNFSS